jgi:hypothetical protein
MHFERLRERCRIAIEPSVGVVLKENNVRLRARQGRARAPWPCRPESGRTKATSRGVDIIGLSFATARPALYLRRDRARSKTGAGRGSSGTSLPPATSGMRFRLPFSGFEHTHVVLCGESFVVLGRGPALAAW